MSCSPSGRVGLGMALAMGCTAPNAKRTDTAGTALDSADPAEGCTDAQGWLASQPQTCFTVLQDAVEQAIVGDRLTLLDPADGAAVHLSITHDLYIDGAGLTLTSDGTGAVITVLSGRTTLSQLHLRGGSGDLDPGFGEGEVTIGGVVNALRADHLGMDQVSLSGGEADWGGGLMGPADGTLHLTQTTVDDCEARRLGGGVWMRQGDLWKVTVSASRAPYAAGLALRSAVDDPTTSTFSDVLITANHASVKGGGLHLAGGASLRAADLTIDENTAQQAAGAHVYDSVGAWSGGTLTTNSAQVGGGGLMIDGGAPMLDHLNIVANGVTGDGLPDAEGVGGGIWAVRATTDLTTVSILRNVAGWGAGLMLAGDPMVVALPTLTLHDVALHDNQGAAGARGSAIVVSHAALMATDLEIHRNAGQHVGGLHVESGWAQVTADWADNTPVDVGMDGSDPIASVVAGATVQCDSVRGTCTVE